MRFPAILVCCFAIAASVCAGISASLPAQGQESSSQTNAAPVTTTQPAPVYVSVDPLAGVRYDNKWDVSLEMAYAHTKAGPNLLQGSNLGGLSASASYYLARRWRLEATGRPYVGTSGAAPNPYNINGPFIAEYFFAGGAEFLGPHNKHGALVAHVLGGGVYGDFEHDLRGNPPQTVGFYNTQVAPALIMGGHFDLNRSPRWVFRMTPDALLTDFATNYGKRQRQFDINASFSVGVAYRFLPRTKK